ncbi:complex I NDUFA9 subunit family protein [Phaeobacter gallaeciensis]|uniref:Complex I NDUFA9 subunit family protein n=2 Tax=Roseobacteraceae TaxID=2854170 RepID=A0A366WW90_9RHOB|nr:MULTISPECIES: complex I NDUFA9 subunit family protein [Roseobacteraceae]MBT3141279.1 complex I NDUFA9 subunit family protein [Falsiruegeria litorea]MBT8170722.1 complex I NDUFA9 subunit family protein [Falsiruegeria litorea]RBW54409.1 complex I NDUFA9 subunit family protein [Phaeobacter gallaeciensis]
MSKLVTIYGGSGFVGRYIARRMASEGWRVRVAVRRPNEAMHVKPYGVVGQVEPVLCNVRDDASVAAALKGADAVVNCVGILNERGKNGFDSVQVDGAERIARAAAKAGVLRMVHLSAIGADAESDSDYLRSKAEGEAAVLKHMPQAMILRPSVIFGPEDQFFNRFAGMTRLGPILAAPGAETKFQPVFVDDVAQAAAKGVMGEAEPDVYELGGPDVASLRSLLQMMLTIIHRRRIILGMPGFAARLMASVFDFAKFASFGLFPNNLLTRDQVKCLQIDNVVSAGAKGFDALGIEPVTMASVLPEYLWKFRPSGQYDEIKDSAKNLRA